MRNVGGRPHAISPASREDEERDANLLRILFENGKLIQRTTLAEIRERVNAGLRDA